MVAATVDAFGRLDVAVNNAGTPGTYKPFAEQRLDDWQRTVDVNLTGTFVCLQAELARDGRGRPGRHRQRGLGGRADGLRQPARLRGQQARRGRA